MNLAGSIGIVGELALAGEQAHILDAANRFADGLGHGYFNTSRTGVFGFMSLARICLDRSPLLM